MKSKKTLILGATTKPGRYALQAAQMLEKAKHELVLVGNKPDVYNGQAIQTNTENIADVDTVTVYLSAINQTGYADFLLALQPKRVIFNPGAENEELAKELEKVGVETLEACTLVMLTTGQY
jgi:uncharacterized protein